MRHPLTATTLVTLTAAALMGCASTATGPVAVADLAPTKGNAVTGRITFTQMGPVVRVAGEVRGLAPNKEHGFHVHDKGDCSSGDGMSAGGHFNPTGKAHGAHHHSEHHAGDLVSLVADAQGVTKVSFDSPTISVAEGASAVSGRGLIVHRDPDDFKTQPTGNSGPRVACAVIAVH